MIYLLTSSISVTKFIKSITCNILYKAKEENTCTFNSKIIKNVHYKYENCTEKKHKI